MSKNLATLDRLTRAGLALIMLVVAFGTEFAAVGLWHWVALALSVVFAVTAAAGFCPLYRLIGIRSCRTC